MIERGLQETERDSEGLTAADAGVNRMAAMMRQWWAGQTLARIAQEHGVTRQRVCQILGSCGCTAELSREVKRNRPDSHRRAMKQRVAGAALLLKHPLARRLTARQRGALLWLSQGLILTDIARRMGTTAQGANYLLVAARWRLERLSLARQHPESSPTMAKPAAETSGPEAGALLLVDIEDLVPNQSGEPKDASDA